MPISDAPDSHQTPISNDTPTVSQRELVTMCRQIAGMMEAEVDILRITRVLRSQTENRRLLEWYDEIDHDLTMGRSVADAMSRAPELFSPFAVSLVRQGEERNALSNAFSRLADFLQQENEAATRHATDAQNAQNASKTKIGAASRSVPNTFFQHDAPTFHNAPLMLSSSNNWSELWGRSSALGAGVLGALAIAEALVLIGWLPARWGRVAARVGSALALGAAAVAQNRAANAPSTANSPSGEIQISPNFAAATEHFSSPEMQSEFEAEMLHDSSWQNENPVPDKEVQPPARAFGGWMADEEPRITTRRPREEEEFD